MHSVHRRDLLVTGAASVLGTLTAGCLGGDDTDDGDDGEDEALAIEHVRLVTAEPDGYREYEEQETGIFDVDDVVWFYFEPEGLTTEDADDGEVGIDVRLELTIRDPDGEAVEEFDEDITRSIAADALDELYFFWNFQPSLSMPEGTYTGDLGVVDQLADDEAEETIDFDIDQAVDFPSQLETAIEQELQVDLERIDVQQDDVTVEYTSAFPIGSENGEFEVSFVAGAFSEQVGSGWGVDALLGTVTDGNGYRYAFQLSADDARSYDEGQINEAEFSALVLDSLEPADFAAFFERGVSQETGALQPSVSVDDRIVELDYASGYAYGQAEATDEIGNVAVIFAIAVDEGWDIDALEAVFTDENGDRFGFEVDAALARDWTAGRISDEDFGNQVTDTVEYQD